MKRFIADYLSFLACKLRGGKWYHNPSTYPGLYGNRAAELKQRIWERCCVVHALDSDSDLLDLINADLEELGQIAGENWGFRPKPESIQESEINPV